MTTQPAARYRRIPAEIEAVQWTGDNADALRAFCGSDFDTIDPEDRIENTDQDAQLLVEASHWVGMQPGDWAVKYEGYFVAKADATFRAVWAPAPVPWVDGDPLMEAIAAAVYEHCDTGDGGIVHDDPRNIAAAATAAVRAQAPADRAAVDRVRTLHTSDMNGECMHCAHSYDPCPTIRALDDAGSAVVDRVAAETGCAHCGKPVRRITGTLSAWWVHDPGGHTICHPQQAATSTRATPSPAVEAQPGKDTEARP